MKTNGREKTERPLPDQEARTQERIQGDPGIMGLPEQSPDERSESGRSGGGPTTPNTDSARVLNHPAVPDPEVPAKARRRRFSADYKMKILRSADRCSGSGEIGALLRREGLYSSHLAAWRKQKARGEQRGLSPRKRGRKADPDSAIKRDYERLRRENVRLKHRLKAAETIIDVQKKISEMLGIPLNAPELDENDS